MTDNTPTTSRSASFRKFFVRGLAIILPTVLTFWLLWLAWNFLQDRIAAPINWGVQELVLRVSPWPQPQDRDYSEISAQLPRYLEDRWAMVEEDLRRTLGQDYRPRERRLIWMKQEPEVTRLARRVALERWWNGVAVGQFRVMDLIGLVLAIALIYTIGLLVGSYIGRRLYERGERIIQRLPLIRSVYPAVKQVTDFFFGSQDQKLQFSKVVAVEYPRKGLWSVGLVTGTTMQLIQNRADKPCLTVFIPSSPTPFTGYVITVPKEDTIDLPITIEDAIKFAVSGGVLVPPNQQIHTRDPDLLAAEPSRARNQPDSQDAH